MGALILASVVALITDQPRQLLEDH